ncbi:hypothetical protein [Phocoenobacter skyensis]|uniref:Uncharacterized protein n=1 Tax=Phocoenobacter skyensis TaxID=97481 RepID=A0ABT9JIY5_9PAST|nr:hypothetical protein [Pasteurella skyensis]MDP8078913.1 hypothetical protein [Pasteurella skyensis]MDP8084774.1 hypothetical protein [Pasteurella skyensis]MDP8184885.1 hypothetical protein [Pasteurella skyensis]
MFAIEEVTQDKHNPSLGKANVKKNPPQHYHHYFGGVIIFLRLY